MARFGAARKVAITLLIVGGLVVFMLGTFAWNADLPAMLLGSISFLSGLALTRTRKPILGPVQSTVASKNYSRRVCQRCGWLNPEENEYCGKCAAILNDETRIWR